jgi:hypothetical protein
MRTTGSMPIPVRRRVPLVPAMVALGVAVASVGAGLAWRDLSTRGSTAPVRTQIASAAQGQDWRFVLNAPVVEVLRHRHGLTPADVVRTHAFGWEGATVREVLRDPVFVRTLRLDPTRSPLDMVRMEVRGT